jgi:succinyl-diaminopimelate desuccinylase
LNSKNQPVDFCLVGEPSSTEKLGDVIKNGRRGSLNGRLVINGKQGHIAYPHLAKNPIHIASETINQLVKENWDQGNEYFPATSFQISNINSGTGATNVIPNSIEILFNFRYSTETTHDELMNRVEEIISNNNLDYDIEWNHSGFPFLTEKGQLVSACSNAIQKIKKYKPTLSTSGGTSDGRFIAPMLNSEVVELGPINSTIHKIDEHVSVDDLDRLSEIYYEILVELLA